MPEQRFAYGPRPLLTLLAGAAFAGVGAFFFHLGATGEPIRLFPLPVYAAGWPGYLLGVLSFGMSAMGFGGLVIAKLHGPRFLVVADDWIEMPCAPLKRETVRVHLSEILDVSRFSHSGTNGVELRTTKGKLTVSNRLAGADGLAAVEAWVVGAPMLRF